MTNASLDPAGPAPLPTSSELSCAPLDELSPRAGWLTPLRLIGIVLIVAGVARIVVATQSLWYDEIYTIRHFLYQPWMYIVLGRYTPNNHVLFTLLSRVCYELVPLDVTLVSRLPSLAAGSLVAAALAWPMRRSRPWLALAMAESQIEKVETIGSATAIKAAPSVNR